MKVFVCADMCVLFFSGAYELYTHVGVVMETVDRRRAVSQVITRKFYSDVVLLD